MIARGKAGWLLERPVPRPRGGEFGNRVRRQARRLIAARVLLVLLLSAHSLSAAADGDTWSRYFPKRVATPANEADWAALAKAYPNRVKRAPVRDAPALEPPAATRVSIRAGIDYVRVRQLANDLDVIATALATPRLVIDLRYVHGELAEALRFGALLARRPLALAQPGGNIEPAGARGPEQKILCLINRGTSGALEAVLDALQAAGEVLLVGTQSAGDTGAFATASNAPAWRVITNDYRRAGGHSLLDVGVTPGLFVATAPDAEDAAYLAFDAGRPIAELLDPPVEKPRFDEARLQERFDAVHAGAAQEDDTSNAAPDRKATATARTHDAPAAKADAPPPPLDRSLQRAVATLIADQVLSDTTAAR